MEEFKLTDQPAAESCRLIDFESSEVRPGVVSGTFFLVVRGRAPCINMRVTLVPRVYIRCPEYWGVEVVGCLPEGLCLPAIKEYSEAIPLQGITGSVGFEVVGASKTEKHKVSGGCKGTK